MRYVLLIFGIIPLLLAGQSVGFQSYSIGEGLSQSQVWCMAEDRRGYLWCGTQGGGINRFDGLQFKHYTVGQGLPSSYIFALYSDQQGRLWAGTNRGAALLQGDTFQVVGSNPLQFNTFCEYKGAVWAGTPEGLFRWDEPQHEWLPLAAPQKKGTIYQLLSVENDMWEATATGLWHNHKPVAGISAPVQAMCRDREGHIWVGNDRGQLWRYLPENHVAAYIPDFPAGKITALWAHPSGTLWIGSSDRGITVRAADGGQYLLNEQNGLPHPYIRQVMQDRQGQMWLASSGGGLIRQLQQPFRHFTVANGLTGNRIYALAEAPDSSIWWSAAQNGLQWTDGNSLYKFTADSGALQGIKCKTMVFDQKGQLWIGTEGKGIAVYDSTLHWVQARDGLSSDWIQKIVCDANGRLWAATYSEGIVQLSPERRIMQQLGWNEGLPDLRVNTMILDANNRLWAGFQSGHIAIIEQNKVSRIFGPKDGLHGAVVRCMAFDAGGRLWAGTRESGLLVFQQGTFVPAQLPQPLSSLNVYAMVCDQRGRMWVGCENGVNCLYIQPSGAVEKVEWMGRNEGFSGIELCHDAALCDRQGALWFGTMNGLTRRAPGSSAALPTPPALHLEQIFLFYKPLQETSFGDLIDPETQLPNGFILPWNQNHLSFSFQAVDLEHPDRVRYRWRLHPAETEWSPWSEQHQISYANLPPGAYRFEVEATNGLGAASLNSPVLFQIERPLWERWYFRLALLLLLALLLWQGFRAYGRNIRQKAAQKQQELELRNHLLELEQKARQLQMNPHFIFNALTAIQGLVAQQETQAARQEIGRFAKLMRSILANSRKNVITLKEEMETLEQYLHVEQFCRENKFTWDIQHSGDIDPDDISLPPMLLQPFVENAVIHGIAHLTRPGHIVIHFSIENDRLVCVVEDNGIGRQAAAVRRQERKPGHQSAAVDITRERLRNLSGQTRTEPVVFSDITAPDGQVCGTRVQIFF